jgi:hypothetical protein
MTESKGDMKAVLSALAAKKQGVAIGAPGGLEEDVKTGVSFGTPAKLADGVSSSDRVSLDVGGTRFTTTIATLTRDKDSFFAAMFSGKFELTRDSSGGVTAFIDRDGSHFKHILNYLRDGLAVVAKLKLSDTERMELAQVPFLVLRAWLSLVFTDRLRCMSQECTYYSLPRLAKTISAGITEEKGESLLRLTRQCDAGWFSIVLRRRVDASRLVAARADQVPGRVVQLWSWSTPL